MCAYYAVFFTWWHRQCDADPIGFFEGVEVLLHSLESVSVATDQLGEKVATLAQEGDRITGAMDELLARAWA